MTRRDTDSLHQIQPPSPPHRFANADSTVIWADAIEGMQSELDDGSVHLLFADPPYNIGKKYHGFIDKWPSDEAYVEWSVRWLEVAIQKLASNGSLYLMCSTQCMPYLDIHLRRSVHILSRIVWHYDSSGVQAKRYFGSMYEPILHCVKDPQNYTFNADEIAVEAKTGAKRRLIDYRKKVPTEYNHRKVPGNVWNIPRVRYRMDEYEEHPTQKPEALLERIILASSCEGDLVVDPFAGTFTTCAVAHRLGRRTVGIDASEEYVKIGLRRLDIQDSYKGEPLVAPEKSYVRRNGNGRRLSTSSKTSSLFAE